MRSLARAFAGRKTHRRGIDSGKKKKKKKKKKKMCVAQIGDCACSFEEPKTGKPLGPCFRVPAHFRLEFSRCEVPRAPLKRLSLFHHGKDYIVTSETMDPNTVLL